jgi:ComF family protein
MKITMIAFGTRGDVQPAVALGKALKAEGHIVRILAGANFTSWIERHGLEAVASKIDIQSVMESDLGRDWIEQGGNPLTQMRLIKKLTNQTAWQSMDEAWAACRDAEVVFSSRVDETRATAVSQADVGLTVVVWLASATRSIADGAFSLLFPDCRICGEPLVQASRLPVCQACRESIVPIEGNLCFICGERLITFSRSFSDAQAEPAPCGLCRRAAPKYSRAVAYGAFEDVLREMIHLLKYDRVLPAAKLLGNKLSHALQQTPAPNGGEWLLVPVPLHVSKLRQRGFNQAELIARAALKSRPVDATLNTKCLVRHRETIPQAGLTRHQRRENLRGAFAVRDAGAVRGRNVLLVDDVFTTGTTISECARVLLRAGARSVSAVTVARVLKADRIRIGRVEPERAA